MTTHDVFPDLDPSRTRLLRHKLEHPLRALLYPEAFAAYQEVQKPRAFGNAKYVLAFVPDRGTAVRFVGAWAVEGERPGRLMDGALVERVRAAHLKLGEEATRAHIRDAWLTDDRAHYSLSKLTEYDDLVGALVVDWGPGARAWVQRADRQPKRVLAE